MKNFRVLFLMMMAVAIVFSACSSDDDPDTEKPVILLNSPTDHQHFHMGDEIHFDAEFSDNIALKQMKIDIHFGEGHDHKSGQHGEEWHWDTIVDLSGRNQKVHFHIDIPHDIKHGEYHFMVFCTDEAGNESWVSIEIDIEDEDHDH